MSVEELRVSARLTLRVAARAMREQGFCVVGTASDSPITFECNDTLIEWGGGFLPAAWQLRIAGRAQRADWDRQFKLLFPKRHDNPPKELGQRFYKAVLERVPDECAAPGVRG